MAKYLGRIEVEPCTFRCAPVPGTARGPSAFAKASVDMAGPEPGARTQVYMMAHFAECSTRPS